MFREAVGERHQQSRGQMRENQEDGKKKQRTSEKKAGENKSLEVHKICRKERKKPWGHARGKEML